MRKPPSEVELSKMSICRSELNHTLNNLGTWIKDEHVEKNWAMQLDLTFITRTRNCVVMKPSKISRNVERLVAETLPRYLDKDCFAVVTASVEEPTRLLESKFDYIFFTSSPSVGRIVMAATAKRLMPVMLELGGKNACYMSDTCDAQNVARWVAWGRFFNVGQTCTTPNYLLRSVEVQEKLLPTLHEAIAEFYRPDPRESPSFTHIMGYKQFQRVQALLRSGHVAIKGQTDTEARYIIRDTQTDSAGSALPTVLVDVQQDEPVVQEDIFRPILPVLTVASVDDTIAFINAREWPMVIYVFFSYKKVRSGAGSSIPLSLGHILLRGSG
ncbi:aldehyde dehydrogenase family 3 member B1-like [Ciconia maguari]